MPSYTAPLSLQDPWVRLALFMAVEQEDGDNERLRDNEYLDVTPGIQSNEAIVRARDNVFDSQGSSGEPRMGDISAQHDLYKCLSGVRGKGYGHVTVRVSIYG